MMSEDEWRSRLRAEIDLALKGRSAREISGAAGLGENYVSQVVKKLNAGIAPRVDTLLKICNALDISPTYVLSGYRIDEESEELLRLYSRAQEHHKQALQMFLTQEPSNGNN